MQELLNDQGIVLYSPSFIESSEAQELFLELKEVIQWRQDRVTLFGKTHPIPRLQAFYSDPGLCYTYSRIKLEGLAWPKVLADLRADLENRLGHEFQGALCNLYRNGRDYAAWHSDNEPELGESPTIASLSLGETRRFDLRHKKDPKKQLKIDLSSGSLLLMKGELQTYWKHQLAKTAKPMGPRINLTFRPIQTQS